MVSNAQCVLEEYTNDAGYEDRSFGEKPSLFKRVRGQPLLLRRGQDCDSIILEKP